MRTYLPLLDSLHIDNTYDAAVRLQKILRTRVTYQTEIPIHYPTAEEIHRTGVGRCDGVVLYGIQLMRAAGFPL